MRNSLILCVVLSLAVVIANSKALYDFKTSYITQLTNINFKDQVSKIRQNTNYVAIVHFYQYSDGSSLNIANQFNTWTTQYNGVFRIGAVDCDQFPSLCREEKVTVYPTFKIYPPVPMPPIDIVEGITVDKIQKIASKYLHSNIIQITSANAPTFLAEHPSVPKVLLFSDKKGVPSVYKGLSVAFQKKLNFGVARSQDTSLVSKYGIKKFPSIIVIKTGQKKPFVYQGKEFNFRDIFEFLNIYSQVFVPGGGSSLDSVATKQWMTQLFPQMYDRSAKDICLGLEDTLCVILITNQKPSKQVAHQFQQLGRKFERKIDRGAQFKFMWLNAAIEKAWGASFEYNGQDKVVILNPGKRKRYTTHQGAIHKDTISQTLDTIFGGDARFNRVSQLPSFQMRAE